MAEDVRMLKIYHREGMLGLAKDPAIIPRLKFKRKNIFNSSNGERDQSKPGENSSEVPLDFSCLLGSPNFIIVNSDAKCQRATLQVSVCAVWVTNDTSSQGNSIHLGAYDTIRTFAIGMDLGKERICSLFVTHLVCPGDAQKEEREKEKKNDLVKTPCKHANQTSWWYLWAER